jgi:hypothetical protein
MRQWRGEKDEPQSSQMSSDLESLGAIFRQEIEKKRRLEQQLICENPPSKRRCVQSEAFVRDASVESIDLV